MTEQERAAMQQALEFLENGNFVYPTQLADNLRAALAQEPVAWGGHDLDAMVEAFSRVIEAHYQRANPFQNPIDMDAQMALRALRGFIPAMKAYTAPSQRPPLTDEEIAEATAGVLGLPHEIKVELARAIERKVRGE